MTDGDSSPDVILRRSAKKRLMSDFYDDPQPEVCFASMPDVDVVRDTERPQAELGHVTIRTSRRMPDPITMTEIEGRIASLYPGFQHVMADPEATPTTDEPLLFLRRDPRATHVHALWRVCRTELGLFLDDPTHRALASVLVKRVMNQLQQWRYNMYQRDGVPVTKHHGAVQAPLPTHEDILAVKVLCGPFCVPRYLAERLCGTSLEYMMYPLPPAGPGQDDSLLLATGRRMHAAETAAAEAKRQLKEAQQRLGELESTAEDVCRSIKGRRNLPNHFAIKAGAMEQQIQQLGKVLREN